MLKATYCGAKNVFMARKIKVLLVLPAVLLLGKVSCTPIEYSDNRSQLNYTIQKISVQDASGVSFGPVAFIDAVCLKTKDGEQICAKDIEDVTSDSAYFYNPSATLGTPDAECTATQKSNSHQLSINGSITVSFLTESLLVDLDEIVVYALDDNGDCPKHPVIVSVQFRDEHSYSFWEEVCSGIGTVVCKNLEIAQRLKQRSSQ